MRFIDYTGKKFEKLLVISFNGRNKWNESLWNCVCDCGNSTVVKSRNLYTGKTKSCGCIRKGCNRKNVINLRYGRLVVVKLSHQIGKASYYECLCDCGNRTVVAYNSLGNGNTKSCGCLKKEKDKLRIGEQNPNWNSNLSDNERINGRFFDGYKEWCYLVKVRDNFRCQICGNTKSGSFVSHHLNNYKDFPDQRILLENGVCLCQTCHKGFHKIYGYRHTTEEQFKEYKIKCQAN